MEKQKKFKQTWNAKSRKYVLIDCSEGIKGGMTGKMSEQPFEGVPIVNDKPGKNGAQHKNEKAENEQGKTKQGNQKETETDGDPAESKGVDDPEGGGADWWFL